MVRRSSVVFAASLVVLAILSPAAAAAPAGHGGDKPKYYFPKHVKRMIVTNSTTTISSTSAKEPFHTPPEPLPFSTPLESPTSSSPSSVVVVPPATTPETTTTTSHHTAAHVHKSPRTSRTHTTTRSSHHSSKSSTEFSTTPDADVVTPPSTTPSTTPPSTTPPSTSAQQETTPAAEIPQTTPSKSVAPAPLPQAAEPSKSSVQSDAPAIPITTPTTQPEPVGTAPGQHSSNAVAHTTANIESGLGSTEATDLSTTKPSQPVQVHEHSEAPVVPAHKSSNTISKPGIFPPNPSILRPGTGQGSTATTNTQSAEQSGSTVNPDRQPPQETGSSTAIAPIQSQTPGSASSGTNQITSTEESSVVSASSPSLPVLPLPVQSHASASQASQSRVAQITQNSAQSSSQQQVNTNTAPASTAKASQSLAAQTTQHSAQPSDQQPANTNTAQASASKASASEASQSQATQVSSNSQQSADTNTAQASASKASPSQAAQSTPGSQQSADTNTAQASASKASPSQAAQGTPDSQQSADTNTAQASPSKASQSQAAQITPNPAQSQPDSLQTSTEQSSTPKPIIPIPIPSNSNGVGISAGISAGNSGLGVGISVGNSGGQSGTQQPVKTTLGQGKPTTAGAASTGQPGSPDSVVPVGSGKPTTGSQSTQPGPIGTLVGASSSVVNSGPLPSKPSSQTQQAPGADSTSGRGGIIPISKTPKPSAVISVPVTILGSDTTFTTASPVTIGVGAGASTVAQPLNTKNPPAGASTGAQASNSEGLPPVVPITISKSNSLFVTQLPVATPTAVASNSAPVLPPAASNSQAVISLPVVVSQPDTTFTANLPITNPAAALSTAAAAVSSGVPHVLSLPITISDSGTTFVTNVPISNPGGAISTVLGAVTSKVVPIPSVPGAVTSNAVPIPSVPVTISNGDTVFTSNVPINTPKPATSGNVISPVPINTPKPASSSGNVVSPVVTPIPSKSLGGAITPSINPSATARPANPSTLVGVSAVVTPGSPKSTQGQESGIANTPLSGSQTTARGPAAATTGAPGVSGAPTGGIVPGPHTSGTVNGVTPSGSEPSNVPVTDSQPGASQSSVATQPEITESKTGGPDVPTDSSAAKATGTAVTGTSPENSGSAPTANQGSVSSQPGAVGTTHSEPGAASATGQPSASPAAAQHTTQGVQPAPSSVVTANVASQSKDYGTKGPGPTSLSPTATDSFTAQAVPSSIIVAPSRTSAASQSQDFTATGIPSSLPHVITPPGGAPDQPPNTTLVQIGFLYPLNYPFVLANTLSQKQIFKYVPPGIAYGLGIDDVNVTMQTLRAYDTTANLHYITTLALAYVPSGMVDKLSLDLHTPATSIYHNPDPSVKTLFSMVNPALPIRADDTGSAATSGAASGPSSTASGYIQPGAPIGGGMGNDMPVRPSSVGIGVGVVCGAAAYGAAMFFVARRYKNRRQSHQRSPSLLSSPVMSGSNPDVAGASVPFMSGARGDGGRSTSPMDGYGYGRNSRGSGRSGSTGRQQISAPVMAENSLGWN